MERISDTRLATIKQEAIFYRPRLFAAPDQVKVRNSELISLLEELQNFRDQAEHAPPIIAKFTEETKQDVIQSLESA